LRPIAFSHNARKFTLSRRIFRGTAQKYSNR
jgi:ribosomal protein S14